MKWASRRLTMQLTPLLDLLLIVIFAQYMEVRDQTNSDAEQQATVQQQFQEATADRDILKQKLQQHNKQIQQQKQQLQKEQGENQRLKKQAIAQQILHEQMLTTQKKQATAQQQQQEQLEKLIEQRALLSKHLAKLFRVSDDSLKKTLGRLSAADIAHTKKELERLQKTITSLADGTTPQIVRHVVKYDELLKRCDLWEIHIDPKNIAFIAFGQKTHRFRYSAKPPVSVDGKTAAGREKNRQEILRYRKELATDFEQKLLTYYKSLPQLKNVVIILLSRNSHVSSGTYTAAKVGMQRASDRINIETGSRIHVVSTDLGQLKYDTRKIEPR